MQTKLLYIKDGMIVVVSIMIIGLSVAIAVQNGMFTISLADDELLTWHLIRSSGIFAYILLTVSMIWGLFLSNQLIKDWSPGPVSISIHSTLSWLGVLLTLFHALLLMFDEYFTYTLADVFVPFTGPYRPLWVGFGTLSLWIMILVTVSFAFKKWLGQKAWKRLHYLSYGAYFMSTLHGLFAGTDSELLGFRVMVGAGVLIVVLLTGARIGKQQTTKPRNHNPKATTRARQTASNST
jgi:methionine sulfoxide reductase heme-binding subunit